MVAASWIYLACTWRGFSENVPGYRVCTTISAEFQYRAELLSCSDNWLLHCEVVDILSCCSKHVQTTWNWTPGVCLISLSQEAEQQTLGRLLSSTETSSMFFLFVTLTLFALILHFGGQSPPNHPIGVNLGVKSSLFNHRDGVINVSHMIFLMSHVHKGDVFVASHLI